MSSEKIEKIHLGYYPTPLSRLDKISKETGVNLYIKRDDLCGVAFGGNKIRKLEYLLAHAKAAGYDTVLTVGGAQSNHATLTAASCRKLGLNVILVLKKRGETGKKGNLLLDDILNVEVVFVDTDDYRAVYVEADRVMETLKAKGKKPYLIPMGGSVPLGALGYYDAVGEMAAQATQIGFTINHIVLASGSGGTHAGVLLGGKAQRQQKGQGQGSIRVTGITVSVETDFQQEICRLANEAAKLLGQEQPEIALEEVVLKEYVGPGYAVPSEEGSAAIRLMAEKEGIFLDPVYTGKAFAGCLDLCKKGYFAPGENVVFIHTGGTAALFALPV